MNRQTLAYIYALTLAGVAQVEAQSLNRAHRGQGHDYDQQHEHEEQQKYTCPMHPEVVRDHPGNCPKCGMKLVPLREERRSTSKAGAIDPYGYRSGQAINRPAHEHDHPPARSSGAAGDGAVQHQHIAVINADATPLMPAGNAWRNPVTNWFSIHRMNRASFQ